MADEIFNEFNLDPRMLEIYKTLLGLQQIVPQETGPISPETPETTSGPGMLQRIRDRILQPMTGGLEKAFSAGVPAIPAYRLYQKYLGQPFMENVVNPMSRDIQYILSGQEPEGQVQSPTGPDITPPPTPISILPIPSKRAIPKAPRTGEQVGTPQYTSPSGQGIVSPSIPSETPAPIETPATTMPTSAAAIPDFTKLVQPWKPKTDYEKELMDIFDKAVPKWEDLPKAKSLEPKTPMDALARFARDIGLSILGKDIFALKKGEIAEEETKAGQERNYVIQRASQLANFKLSALSKKMEREESDREGKAKWLEYVGNANPEYRKNPSYQAAVASIRGIPAEQVAPLLQSMVNPTTGLLEGMYKSPIEALEEQQKAMLKMNKQNLVDAGVSPERAAYMAAGGSKEMLDFYGQQYQNAIEAKDMKKVKEIEAKIKLYQSFAQRDVTQEKALALLQKDPKLTSFDKIFSNKETAQYYKDVTYAEAIFGEKVKAPPHIAAKEVKVDEIIKQEAKTALNNSEAGKAFTTKYGHTPISVLFKGDAGQVNLPEPYATGAKMAPPATAKDGDKLKMWVDTNPEVKRSIQTQILYKYKPVFDIVNQKLIEAKKGLLSEVEMNRIATASNSGDNELVWHTISEILTERKVPLSK